MTFVFLLIACGNEAPAESKALAPAENELITKRSISIYNVPDGQPVQELPVGTRLQLTGEVSSKLYYQSTRNDTLLEPFLSVILPSQQAAWVYADPANFSIPSTPSYHHWQWNNRLRSLLSPDEVAKYYYVWENWENTQQASVLLLTFQATRELRERVETALRDYPLLPLADYQDLLPASWPYQTSDRTGWWLDYNQWADRSAKLADAEALAALFVFYQKQVYSPDGIEYHFTNWEFPVSPSVKHSLLGRKIHFTLLEELQQLSLTYPFIEAECLLLKDQLLRDICDSGTTYWEEWPVIQRELDTILNTTGWTILTSQDLALLQHRISAFELPNIRERYLGQRNK